MRSRSEAPAAHDQGYVKLQEIPYRGHWLVEQAVLRHTKPGDRIFEGGVSSGYLARRFVEAGRRVDGAEIDPGPAAQAMEVCDRVWVGDLAQLDAGQLGNYQLLLFADTLEHLPDPPAVLRRLKTRLDPAGTLVVSLPNVANWAIRLGLLAGRFRYTDRGILDRTHLRFYTKKTAVQMLLEGGFEVVDIVASVPVPLVKSPTLCRIAHAIGNLRPSLFAYTLVITARPAGRA
ncbi:MAG TPA: methyltransferase domain-containing protein [Acidimicrobiia bacterium]|jgi:2-polyprenyl-3-methyl-5-hydroxy-6-metoxy-1,4-benzoquinol methylase